MRHRVFIRGGYRRNTISEAGGEATGPLFLDQNPTVNSQASTKQYVDSLAENIDAGSFVEGTISGGRIPNFTGDLTKAAGSNEVFITPTGIAPGNFTRVTVNSKGQVTAGTVLTEADLPNLDWSKFADNAPTSLAGYGITDGLNKNNPVMSGTLKVNGPFVNSNDVVNKQYVDQNLTSRGRVGEIGYKMVETPPGGYLRANGGEVSKTTYPTLYAVIGDTFNSQPIWLSGSTQPWALQYEFNELQSNDISGWTTETSLPVAVSENPTFVTKNRVFICLQTTVYSAPIDSNGNIGTWGSETIPISLPSGTAIIVKNKVYIIGLWSNECYSCSINTDGTLGTWVTEPTIIGAGTAFANTVSTSKRIYIFGGWDDSLQATKQTRYAEINEDGTLGNWMLGPDLPIAIYGSAVFTTKNRIFMAGGYNGNYVSSVYSAPIDENGVVGTFTAGISLPNTIGYQQVLTTKNQVYLMGGYRGSAQVNTVYRASINADGTLGTWTTGTALPVAIYGHRLVATGSKLYLIGGYVGSSPVNTVRSTSFAGGLNDYLALTEGTIINVSDPTKFRLPDVKSEYFGSYAYIAYE